MGIKHKRVVTTGTKGKHEDWNDDHTIDGDVDFNKHEAQNLVIENRTDWPAGPVLGQIVYRTDSKQFFTWNGTDWIEYGMPTKEYYVPVGAWNGPTLCPWPLPPYVIAHYDGVGGSTPASIHFFIPHDFTTLLEVVLVGYFSVTNNVIYNICSSYGAVGENLATHRESLINQTVAAAQDIITEIDVSGILTNIAVGDYGGVQIELTAPDPVDMYLWGIRFRYI